MSDPKTSDDLTPAQNKVLKFVRNWIAKNHFPPTRAEISRGLGFASPNAAYEHLMALQRKGVIEVIPAISRGIRLKVNP